MYMEISVMNINFTNGSRTAAERTSIPRNGENAQKGKGLRFIYFHNQNASITSASNELD